MFPKAVRPYTQPVVQRHNEGILRRLAEDCNGTFTTMAKGVADLDMPIMKTVRTRVGYKGLLTLGNPREYDETALCIEVERYARIMMTKPPTASKYVVTPNYATEGIGQVSTQSSATLQHGLPGEPDKDGFAAVRSARVYQIKDDTVPGGKRDVAKEELEKGYEYGRTAVHIGESDSNIVTLETDASLSICGFVPAAKVCSTILTLRFITDSCIV
jgi:ATP-dependent DNA helicase 2 subunit 2